jgi:hypothetical protein
MTAPDGIVGSLNVTPPTGQTFGHLHVWADLYPFVQGLVEDIATTAPPWWDVAAAIKERIEDLEKIRTDFVAILKSLDAALKGSTGDAFQDRGSALVNYMKKLAATAQEFDTPSEATGHDIVVYRNQFWQAYHLYHRVTEVVEDYIVERITSKYHGNPAPSGDLIQRARDIAYQIVEQNLMMPHQRKLLMILAAKYASKAPSLGPLDLRPPKLNEITVKSIGPGTEDDGDDGGSGGGSGRGSGSGSASDTGGGGTGGGSSNKSTSDIPNLFTPSGSGGGSGSGSGTGNGSEYDNALKDAEKGALGGLNNLRKPTDSPARKQAYGDAEQAMKDAFDELGGGGTGRGGGSGSGTGSGIDPNNFSSGQTKPGSSGGGSTGGGLGDLFPGGSGSGGGDGSGSSSTSDRPPTTTDPAAERKKALRDADGATDKAIKDLLNPKGTGETPQTTSDPVTAERKHALEDALDAKRKALDDLGDRKGVDGPGTPREDALGEAKDAVDKAIEDLLNENEASNSDPDIKAAREDALKDAQHEADKAIDKLLGDAHEGGDGTAPGSEGRDARSTALDNVESGLDNAIDDLKDSSGGEGNEIRRDAIDDATNTADKVVDELRRESPDRGLDSLLEIEGDAYGDAKRELTSAFDDLINDTLADPNLNAEEKLERVEALHDVKIASMQAIDQQTLYHTAEGDEASLSEFLSGNRSPSPSPNTLSSSTTQGATNLSPTQGSPITSGEVTPMVLDGVALGAANAANQGMPMAPPMGGAGGATGQPRERDRNTWLDADPGLWDEGSSMGSWSAIGRNPS